MSLTSLQGVNEGLTPKNISWRYWKNTQEQHNGRSRCFKELPYVTDIAKAKTKRTVTLPMPYRQRSNLEQKVHQILNHMAYDTCKDASF